MSAKRRISEKRMAFLLLCAVVLVSVLAGSVSASDAPLVLTGHTAAVTSVCFSQANSLLASGAMDKTVRIWDVASGRTLKILSGHTRTVWSVAFSPDGTKIVSGAGDATVKIWDVATGALLRTL